MLGEGYLQQILIVAAIAVSLLLSWITIQELGNWLAITTVTASYLYMIAICDLHCWLPTSEVYGEAGSGHNGDHMSVGCYDCGIPLTMATRIAAATAVNWLSHTSPFMTALLSEGIAGLKYQCKARTTFKYW